MQFRDDQFLWVEKYRPRRLADCILPADQRETFEQFVAKGEIPNMLLCGGAGMGKTTVARALCEELGSDYIVINGSMNGNIDTLRNEIFSFASTVSFEGKPKVVILDEADYLNPNSTQPALRNFIEVPRLPLASLSESMKYWSMRMSRVIPRVWRNSLNDIFLTIVAS